MSVWRRNFRVEEVFRGECVGSGPAVQARRSEGGAGRESGRRPIKM